MVRYDDIDGQSVNIIDQAAIKAEVAAAIGAAGSTAPTATTASKPNPATVVDVINSGSMSGLASDVSRALKKRGYTMGQVRDRNAGEPSSTTIEYGAGADTDARNLASLLGLDAPNQPDSTIQPGHIRVTVDNNYSLPATDETIDTTSDETTTTTTTTTRPASPVGTGTPPPAPTPAPIRASPSTAAGCRALTKACRTTLLSGPASPFSGVVGSGRGCAVNVNSRVIRVAPIDADPPATVVWMADRMLMGCV